MSIHPLAGKPAPKSILTNIPRLIAAYYQIEPDPELAEQRVAFGTSGHRGCSFDGTFNEAHILATTQAICEHRRKMGIEGPLFLGMDTHALSEPAFITALEVLAGNEVDTRIQKGRTYTPTPAVSHAILTWNRRQGSPQADGIVITPSHNPPDNGGFKYNPPNGGPAGDEITRGVAQRANELLLEGNRQVRRKTLEQALKAPTTRMFDFMKPYVEDLEAIIDMKAIQTSGLRIGADPMGGAALYYWEVIAERYGLDIDVLNDWPDPTFSFMHVDRDGRIRMDCSSPYAMAGLIGLKDRYDIAFGNDADYDRHGIVTPSDGLMNPNHYLAVAIDYLFQHRPDWPAAATIGKTLVSSSMIDRVGASLERTVCEVPVGFKWFVEGLLDGSFGFGGEESAGASFLRRDGTVWTTDKDGLILDLLAAEITARTGQDPAQYYDKLRKQHGDPVYERIDAPASASQKKVLTALSPEQVQAATLAGEPIEAKLTRAPGNNRPIGGLKVVTANGWFAARPSGTEAVYKIYAESFKGADHLACIQQEARAMVDAAFKTAGAAD